MKRLNKKMGRKPRGFERVPDGREEKMPEEKVRPSVVKECENVKKEVQVVAVSVTSRMAGTAFSLSRSPLNAKNRINAQIYNKTSAEYSWACWRTLPPYRDGWYGLYPGYASCVGEGCGLS